MSINTISYMLSITLALVGLGVIRLLGITDATTGYFIGYFIGVAFYSGIMRGMERLQR